MSTLYQRWLAFLHGDTHTLRDLRRELQDVEKECDAAQARQMESTGQWLSALSALLRDERARDELNRALGSLEDQGRRGESRD